MERERNVETARARTVRQALNLRARVRQLDHINRELDDFACIASHDLKEPLQGISTYCQLLREDYQDRLDSEGKRRLDAMVGMCGRLEGLIDSLLTYSRIGKTPPTPGEVDLNVLVGQILETLRPVIQQRRASVRVVGSLPKVAADPALAGTILANLISNGLKFNRSRQPRVEIGCSGGSPPAIYVRDNGIGIDPKHHEAIFTVFRRLHSPTQYEGSGVGLTIVRKIVQSHGGRVRLESKPGAGSTFFFTLAPDAMAPAAGRPHWLDRPERADALARRRP